MSLSCVTNRKRSTRRLLDANSSGADVRWHVLPLALGHHGTISTKLEDGRWVARCRVRDHDGVTRARSPVGDLQTAAQRALQDGLRRRHGERDETLRPNSRFRDAPEVWLAKIGERREDSTLDIYTHWLNKLVLPQLGELRLIECDVANIDAFFCDSNGSDATSSRRTARPPRSRTTPPAAGARSGSSSFRRSPLPAGASSKACNEMHKNLSSVSASSSVSIVASQPAPAHMLPSAVTVITAADNFRRHDNSEPSRGPDR